MINLKKNKSYNPISYPEYSEHLAEFIGIILGDGNIHAYCKGKKVRTYMVRIAGDYEKDEDYLRCYIPQLCKILFNIDVKFYRQPNSKELMVLMHSKAIVEFLAKMGLKAGNKIKNQSTIPNWIWSKPEYLRACIRGLMDTDGSFYELLPQWPGLFQLTLENRNITLLRDSRKALLMLGFRVSKICGNRTEYGTKFYITRKDQIQKYIKEIGFSNKKNLNKIRRVP